MASFFFFFFCYVFLSDRIYFSLISFKKTQIAKINLKEYFIVRFQRKVDTIETTKFADFLLQNKVIESFQLFAYATKAENYSLMLHAIES